MARKNGKSCLFIKELKKYDKENKMPISVNDVRNVVFFL